MLGHIYVNAPIILNAPPILLMFGPYWTLPLITIDYLYGTLGIGTSREEDCLSMSYGQCMLHIS